ncbi:SpoIIE family protein phosphatase [Clostridium sp. 'deep sea']|uniref:SpoIIE family protein phosphatase n=1 Tax=Clostridium sp. 'deep sea' TaxID=2779445 RepID=UPI0018967661|nr:SpoIIE family protein phosphatase [Clostridium sp. 'deep sea']QOR36873.1 SpoIIE family protein phosphatase [Clostridium sp. 'deep sea']
MMSSMNYIDVSYNYLNKKNENLCGDKVQLYKGEDRTIIVLADGLGSGVKANILATLTSQIALTMLKRNASIHEVVDTIIHTLPVCSVRKIAYSTFSIVEIDKDLNCQIYEYDNPAFFFIRNYKIMKPEKESIIIHNKEVFVSRFKLEISDVLYLCSDGVVHAGVGRYLPFGWQWEDVGKYLIGQQALASFHLCNKLLNACNELYEDMPDDDTTVVAVKIRHPQNLHIFTGPPVVKDLDKPFVEYFNNLNGKKMICGGTAAQIYARETNKKLITELEYINPEIPVTARIKGVNLVTEGIVTMSKCVELIEKFKEDYRQVNFELQDGATRMLRMFLEESTNIKIWFGKSVNGAHQHFGFPQTLSLKINVVNQLISALKSLGKEITIEYISEVNYESI